MSNRTLSYLQWIGEIERELDRRAAGMSTDFLPDLPYRDWFDRGLTASQAAVRALGSLRG